MNDTLPPTPRRPLRWLLPATALLLVAAAGYGGWQYWQQLQREQASRAQTSAVQLRGLADALDALRRDQRATSQRLQDAAVTNRVLRDEMLGLSQRSALLEENLAKLADSTAHGRQAVYLDEAELLLGQAGQRLAYADDVEGARRLYAMAATALGHLADNDGLNLRQALIQERDALDALGQGPRHAARARLATIEAALPSLPLQVQATATPASAGTPWWQRTLAPFVDITPTRLNGPLSDAQRQAGLEALQVELTLARAAIERGDRPGSDAALRRVERWLPRLWPDSPALRNVRGELQGLRTMPLQLDSATLGSTLQQLRTLRDRR
ncbi:uroporphyrinogen-III C-methyltransferase [Stenotrophomonas sp. 24(2023)]|uniref:uroporphyrinogen-III C-methyltransferase n=1 Tax=Stenotrophomonas sp. 24(2023) TaxID=3068324 RepID=UPI0027E01B43|nr:uroporphyrinogen-III C-methyltransferase [Stenotrophomonas sp. 24(2023)]WMJ71209.1 uroporphyrinogen-III C-methyltransferase [Stenotrophomonas sp. 24(2023)]